MRFVFLAAACVVLAGGAARAADACPGHPDAIGTSRTITVDPTSTPFLGQLQYKQTVPLQKGEVILTFDDGPLPPMTTRVLDTLQENCVKATFFIVGRMASAYPAVLQRISKAGHTIGTHSQTHPLIFPKLTQEAGIKEIDQGFASTNAALAPIGAHTVPFFRFPGLGRTKFYEAYTQQQGIAVFSVDAVADDWMHLKPEEVMQRALDRLTARGSGILLLHDIQPSTAVMLPTLLKELKARGFRIVHMEYAATPAVAAKPAATPGVTAAPVAASTAAAATAAAAAVSAAPATPPTPSKPVALKPVAKPVASKPPAQAQAETPAPAAAQEAPQPAPAENPFAHFWPRLLGDLTPKELR